MKNEEEENDESHKEWGRTTHKHGLSTAPEVRLQQDPKPLTELRGVHL